MRILIYPHSHTGALAAVTFLEEIDRAIGYNHLFKRSILLIKLWCTHESMNYCGYCIIGSKSVGLNYILYSSIPCDIYTF